MYFAVAYGDVGFLLQSTSSLEETLTIEQNGLSIVLGSVYFWAIATWLRFSRSEPLQPRDYINSLTSLRWA